MAIGVYITKYPVRKGIKAADTDVPYIKTASGVESFSISYNMEWEGVSVYGRQDPIQSYKSTGETMSLSFPLNESLEYSTAGDKTTSLDSLNTMIKYISKLCRPIYLGGAIKQSPLIYVVVGADTEFVTVIDEFSFPDQCFGGKPYIVAPSSLSIDFGDRARTISSYTEGGGDLGDALTIVPSKCLVTLSGAILYPDIRYVIAKTGDSGLVGAPGDPQRKADASNATEGKKQ